MVNSEAVVVDELWPQTDFPGVGHVEHTLLQIESGFYFCPIFPAMTG